MPQNSNNEKPLHTEPSNSHLKTQYVKPLPALDITQNYGGDMAGDSPFGFDQSVMVESDDFP